MEKTRLPFLGPGWFEQAKAAGAKNDGAGWYFPPGAVVPPALAAHIDAAQPQNRRKAGHKTAESAAHAAEAEPPPPPRVMTAAELEAFREAGREGLRAIRGQSVSDGKRWAVTILERQAAGDATVCHYAARLAREALRV